jgi:menaquinone-9 beta-reductase
MVDVAIIGGGPGGGMAACGLAATGLRALLLEKETMPRHKPCGGGLTGSVTDLFSWDISPLVERYITRVRNLLDFERPYEVPTGSPILMVNRSRFDAHLVERAVTISGGNVQVREAVRVRSVIEEADRIVIECDGGERIAAAWLIAADGAFSQTARSLGLAGGASQQGIALDAEVKVAPEIWEVERERATFNFFCVPYGYGWIFPKRDSLSCGIGAWRGKPRLQRLLDEFLQRSFPTGSILQVHRSGHAIPLHQQRRTIATRRVCLVGDAASLVDPVMGEGIRFALQSGAIAAEVVGELAGVRPSGAEEPAAGEMDCRLYQQRIEQAIGEKFSALQSIAQTIFFEAPEYFYENFVIGARSYSRLSQDIAGQMRDLRMRQ